MPALLLHACCGPCLLVPAADLAAQYDRMTVFWYNPNIHPSAEYARREEHLRAAAARLALPVTAAGGYDAAAWLTGAQAAAGAATAAAGGPRCRYCLHDRLRAAADAAAAGGYAAFSTTMLYSPYLDHAFLVAAGAEEGRRVGVRFHAADWRARFHEGQRQAQAWGLYRQNYCGCIYSDNERQQRRQQRAQARAAAALAQGVN
ncbi:MAG TPA: epoxyqueuosine reductase QueH [bacterium]|nr:epoxyqueuosine reductase QueH [bacterium]